MVWPKLLTRWKSVVFWITLNKIYAPGKHRACSPQGLCPHHRSRDWGAHPGKVTNSRKYQEKVFEIKEIIEDTQGDEQHSSEKDETWKERGGIIRNWHFRALLKSIWSESKSRKSLRSQGQSSKSLWGQDLQMMERRRVLWLWNSGEIEPDKSEGSRSSAEDKQFWRCQASYPSGEETILILH